MELTPKIYKKAALQNLNGRWAMPVVITLISTLLSLAFLFPFYPWKEYFAVLWGKRGPLTLADYSIPKLIIFMLIEAFIIPTLKMAELYIYSVLYKAKDSDKNVKFSDFITGFSFWGKAIGSTWWRGLWIFLWELAGMVPGIIIGIFIGIICIVTGSSTDIIMTITPLVIYAGVIPVVIYKGFQYCLTDYIIVDNEKAGVRQALNISKIITKGYKVKIFVLELSFIGWSILAAIMPVGFLWLNPYMNTTLYHAFRTILEDYNRKHSEPKTVQTPGTTNSLN